MLEREADLRVVSSIIFALGHLHEVAAVPLILPYLEHPDRDVRDAVAFALGCSPDDPQSIYGLVKLSSDTVAEVRDWAVLGLGVLGDADSPEIREALLRCLQDENEDVREEAAVGLGKRKDERVVPALLKMLDQPAITVRVIDAAVGALGLDCDQKEWSRADYQAALTSRFKIPT